MSTWPHHIRKNPCLLSRLGSRAPTQRPEPANLLDRVRPAAGELQSRIRRKHRLQLATTRLRKDRNSASAFSGSPPRRATRAARCSSASVYETSGRKKDVLSAGASITAG